METRFYRCSVCGQIVEVVKRTGSPLICCGKPMEELAPFSLDVSREKHVPVIRLDGDKVRVAVGTEPHPMTGEHFIEWIALETEYGRYRMLLKPGELPEACFCLCHGDQIKGAYAYCNLHGLWMAELR